MCSGDAVENVSSDGVVNEYESQCFSESVCVWMCKRKDYQHFQKNCFCVCLIQGQLINEYIESLQWQLDTQLLVSCAETKVKGKHFYRLTLNKDTHKVDERCRRRERRVERIEKKEERKMS